MGVILFVRHGKASLGAADYDVLSDTGRLQSELLGTELSRRDVTATRILTGRLNRQQQTARCTRLASKWSTSVEVDEAWNEFDHEFTEPFPAFTKRVDDASRTLAAEVGSGETVVVFTSAGVIGWVAASLLGGGEPQWSALHRVAVNSGVTKVVVGSRGSTLVTFNEHSHLPPQLVTYR
ncbi:histidine phosphatase family protein [Streptomyces sp. NBC_01478]|uniref:histidine phosphatase family protein n=1 Tax=Streptomyces sp. NBC_01478 TaxID=2903882 RepID=UPI002E31C25C|nr:histidine phosphatase family protein [Streptomyces sp. NBC_01478]